MHNGSLLRLLDGDQRIAEAVRLGELGDLSRQSSLGSGAQLSNSVGGGLMASISIEERDILQTAEDLRWEIGQDFHEQLMENIYAEAAQLADRAVTWPDEKPRFDLDRTIDRLVTSRVWGFPMMILLFTLVFWLTITGANYPIPISGHDLNRHNLPAAASGCGSNRHALVVKRGTLLMACIWPQPGW